jgi:hypothetical protein
VHYNRDGDIFGAYKRWKTLPYYAGMPTMFCSIALHPDVQAEMARRNALVPDGKRPENEHETIRVVVEEYGVGQHRFVRLASPDEDSYCW